MKKLLNTMKSEMTKLDIDKESMKKFLKHFQRQNICATVNILYTPGIAELAADLGVTKFEAIKMISYLTKVAEDALNKEINE